MYQRMILHTASSEWPFPWQRNSQHYFLRCVEGIRKTKQDKIIPTGKRKLTHMNYHSSLMREPESSTSGIDGSFSEPTLRYLRSCFHALMRRKNLTRTSCGHAIWKKGRLVSSKMSILFAASCFKPGGSIVITIVLKYWSNNIWSEWKLTKSKVYR